MGFQTSVVVTPAQGVAGDFASANPFFIRLADPINVSGVTAPLLSDGSAMIGLFAVPSPTVTGMISSANSAATSVLGFIHREMNAQINTLLVDNSMTVMKGMPVAIMTAGDFWCALTGTQASAVQPNTSVYYNPSNATIAFAAGTGFVNTNFVTGSTIAAGSVAGTVFKITKFSIQ